MRAVWLGIAACLVITAATFIVRARARVKLADRMLAFRGEVFERALAPRRGLDPVPSERDVRSEIDAIARELDLTATVLDVHVRLDAPPEGAGERFVSRELAGVRPRYEIDAEGNEIRPPVPAEPSPGLRIKRIVVRVRVSGDAFLVHLEQTFEETRTLGYSL